MINGIKPRSKTSDLIGKAMLTDVVQISTITLLSRACRKQEASRSAKIVSQWLLHNAETNTSCDLTGGLQDRRGLEKWEPTIGKACFQQMTAAYPANCLNDKDRCVGWHTCDQIFSSFDGGLRGRWVRYGSVEIQPYAHTDRVGHPRTNSYG